MEYHLENHVGLKMIGTNAPSPKWKKKKGCFGYKPTFGVQIFN